MDSDPRFTVTDTVCPRRRLGCARYSWLLTSTRVSWTTSHTGLCEMSSYLFIQRGISFNLFQLSSRLERTNTQGNTHAHTHTHTMWAFIPTSSHRWIHKAGTQSCAPIILIQFNTPHEKKKKTAVKRIPVRNQLKPGHDGSLIVWTPHDRWTH